MAGFAATQPVHVTDAVVIGAGPVGLYQAFQLGLQEISCHLIDALPSAGGQCTALYPDKPIYDLPGIPACSGRELGQQLERQLEPFATPRHFGQQVQGLSRQADGGWRLETDGGQAWVCRTVFIAAGLGAFVPRRPHLEGLQAFEGRQIHYYPVEPHTLSGQRVVVMGGEDSALETVLALAASGLCAHLTLLHRHTQWRAEQALQTALCQAVADGRVQLCMGQPVGWYGATDRLQGLEVATGDEQQTRLPTDALLPRLGLSPKLGPIADWGLALERKALLVQPGTQATSENGIYAVGDVCQYPHKQKLLLSGFYEATQAAVAARAFLHPHERPMLQYTTTSPRLHALLGVRPRF